MMLELESATDVASHAIYDPAAIAHLNFKNTADDKFQLLFDVEPLKGSLLLYEVASDGATLFRIYVDEPLPVKFARRIESKIENLLLRIPSGTIVASGVEYVNNSKEIAAARPFTPGSHALVTKANIPPGNYLATAYELDFDWDKDIAPVLKRATGPSSSREGCLGALIGIGTIGTLITILVITFASFDSGWSWTRLWWVGIPLGLLTISAIIFTTAIPKDYYGKKDQIASQFPPNVIVLKRLPDDADLTRLQGGGFGFAARERFAEREPARGSPDSSR